MVGLERNSPRPRQAVEPPALSRKPGRDIDRAIARSDRSADTGLDVIEVPQSAWMACATPPLRRTASVMKSFASSPSSVACTSKCTAHREKILIITYRWYYTPRCGPASLVMSHDHTSSGPVAISSGFLRAGCGARGPAPLPAAAGTSWRPRPGTRPHRSAGPRPGAGPCPGTGDCPGHEQLVTLASGQRVRRGRPPLPAPGPDAIAPAINRGGRRDQDRPRWPAGCWASPGGR